MKSSMFTVKNAVNYDANYLSGSSLMNLHPVCKVVLSAVLLVLFSAQSVAGQYSKPSDIPVEVFSAIPVSGYRLSPSGKKIGYFVPVEGRRILIVHNLAGDDRRFVPPRDEKQELVSFFWKTEDIVIFKILMTLNRREFLGRSTETRVVSYNMAADDFHWLGRPKRGGFGRLGDNMSQHDVVIDLLINDPEHILLELDFELDGYPAVYRVNVKTGSRKKIHNQRSGINSWFTDHEGEIRLGWGYRVRGSTKNFRYRPVGGKWLDLTKSDLFVDFEFEAMGPRTGQLYVRGPNQYGTQSMLLVDVVSGEVLEELFSHPKLDIGSSIYHPATGKVAGVRYTDDFERHQYFDSYLNVLQKGLEKALPGMVIAIKDKARDANLYLVLAYNDTDPGRYYVFNRDTRQLVFFANYRAKIDPLLSATTIRVNIPVSDGSEIPAYLTIPKEMEAKHLPTIVLPHGGPWARDSAGWDFEAQFYASRGYAVLKPNFRGSTGYGVKFQDKGSMQWGGLMQEDVTDATHWLINKEIADPERICIVGSSYGGYSAMMGLIQQPDLYACGISVNGVMNLPALKNKDRRTIGGLDWVKKMGMRGVKDSKVSPQQQVDSINDPVLLIAATNDARVPFEQTRKIHKTLKKLEQDSTYIEIDTGTHYMLNAESRFEMLSAAEKFLAKHLR